MAPFSEIFPKKGLVFGVLNFQSQKGLDYLDFPQKGWVNKNISVGPLESEKQSSTTARPPGGIVFVLGGRLKGK